MCSAGGARLRRAGKGSKVGWKQRAELGWRQGISLRWTGLNWAEGMGLIGLNWVVGDLQMAGGRGMGCNGARDSWGADNTGSGGCYWSAETSFYRRASCAPSVSHYNVSYSPILSARRPKVT